MIAIKVNNKKYKIDIEPETPLLWVLRDTLGLTGTKFGCGIGECGNCIVLINRKAVHSCMLPVRLARGKNIITIEGLSENRDHPVQKAWIEEDVPQCGYCQPGVIMATVALLSKKKEPTDTEINEAITNICRCGTYQRIRKAIHLAGELYNEEEVK